MHNGGGNGILKTPALLPPFVVSNEMRQDFYEKRVKEVFSRLHFRDHNPSVAEMCEWLQALQGSGVLEDDRKNFLAFIEPASNRIFRQDTFLYLSWSAKAGVRVGSWKKSEKVIGIYSKQAEGRYFNTTDKNFSVQYVRYTEDEKMRLNTTESGAWVLKDVNTVLMRARGGLRCPTREWRIEKWESGDKRDSMLPSMLRVDLDKSPYRVAQCMRQEILAMQRFRAGGAQALEKYWTLDHMYQLADGYHFVAISLERYMPPQYLIQMSPEGFLFLYERAALWCLVLYSMLAKLPVCKSLWLRHFRGSEALLAPLFTEANYDNAWVNLGERPGFAESARKKLNSLATSLTKLMQAMGGAIISAAMPPDQKPTDDEKKKTLFRVWCERYYGADNESAIIQMHLRFFVLIFTLGFTNELRDKVNFFFDHPCFAPLSSM